MCPSLIEIGSKTAEKNSAQTNKQTNRQTDKHYENNGHLAVNQLHRMAQLRNIVRKQRATTAISVYGHKPRTIIPFDTKVTPKKIART